ncbi:MAG: phosphate starvation-inducible protein PhoH [Candidatus Muproteobacteria bacterium RIFCSPHIGHO2_01_FULL_65_16]|uniref:Phosphate starvation-inducible protein PhoH n=2 Tax=Candidatus Muproteobacteria TaxID=1817795 RepID=A0A1F6TN85_9PROT|nr:MAG: phosphate starvation-inducible protein PhoH [Candidatus Muproteobacteria bacterium RIFCSPHIGHO2_01_FULL_65_16]
MTTKRKIFVLDTNVLIHDPTAILRFHEHDVYLPIVVLEELDKAKVGMSEVARNVRQVSRFLDELVEKAEGDISRGVRLPSHAPELDTGRLHFHMEAVRSRLPDGMAAGTPDNTLLGVTLDLGKSHPDRDVILVSKDINLRIKAHALGIRAEDYASDHVLDDANLLYAGMSKLEADFWDRHGREMESWKEDGRTFYRMTGPKARGWCANQFLYTEDKQAFEAIVRRVEGDTAVIEVVRDYTTEHNKIWGIAARNREQNFALNLLMDPEVDFVTLLGQAGTGKTLLTLAAALTQTLETRRYSEIIMTRMTVPVGEDIGFLPGTEEEKMGPWMGALEDNLDVLHETGTQEHGAWGRAATHDFLRNRIRIKSLNFMRGRTFLKKFLIVDEAQNLSPHQIKTLITRAGPGSKIACLGNIAQIDTPYLTETTSGLTYVVDRFKQWDHSGHITLQRGERSRLADYASETL